MTEIYNKIEQKEKRRTLRNSMPRPEAVIWSRLRGRQLLGQRFRRQYGVGPYILDFYCPALRLAIEIDGESHFREGSENGDLQRQEFIESFGIRFLRFTNEDVSRNLEGVLQMIYDTMSNLDH